MGMVIGKRERESGILNRKIILDHFRKKGELSQRQLCDLTGLHRSTLSKLISNLMDSGLVEESRKNPAATGGKKQTFLRISEGKKSVLGIGLYAKKLTWIHMDLSGKYHNSGEVTLNCDLQGIGTEIIKLISEFPIPITAVCIGLPGIIDSDKGIVVRSGFWNIKGLELGTILTEELNIPCSIDNDVRLMAALECDQKAICSLYIGINKIAEGYGWKLGGFGSAFMHKGKLIRGSNSAAGEIYGFADAIGGQCPLLTDAEMAILENVEGELTAKLQTIATWFSKIMIHLSAIIDPEEIIIGGAIAIRNSVFLKELNRQLKEQHFIYCPGRKLKLSAAKHPHTNMAEGAAHAAFDQLNPSLLMD